MDETAARPPRASGHDNAGTSPTGTMGSEPGIVADRVHDGGADDCRDAVRIIPWEPRILFDAAAILAGRGFYTSAEQATNLAIHLSTRDAGDGGGGNRCVGRADDERRADADRDPGAVPASDAADAGDVVPAWITDGDTVHVATGGQPDVDTNAKLRYPDSGKYLSVQRIAAGEYRLDDYRRPRRPYPGAPAASPCVEAYE